MLDTLCASASYFNESYLSVVSFVGFCFEKAHVELDHGTTKHVTTQFNPSVVKYSFIVCFVNTYATAGTSIYP